MWTRELFGVDKPIIALLHLRALPGDPMYGGSMAEVVKTAAKELEALQKGGVDGILFANEFSKPYQKKADYVTVSAMARVIGELMRDIAVPFGANVVTNPVASVDLAAATGASFVRSAFTGAYLGENGIHTTDVAYTVRRKHYLGMGNLKMLYKVNPESDVYLAERDITTVTKSILFHCAPDALCVSGASAGSETGTDIIETVRGLAGEVPVFCNTGCTAENIAEKLRVSDGACVGTTFKTDGKFANTVDAQRVQRFMDAVRAFRAGA